MFGCDVMYGARKAMQAQAARYLQLCADRGYAPKFSTIRHAGATEITGFTREANYWKLLIDRKMIDNVTGEIINQQAVKPRFENDRIEKILSDEIDSYRRTQGDIEYATEKVPITLRRSNMSCYRRMA